MKKRLNTLRVVCLSFIAFLYLANTASAQCPNSAPLICSDPDNTSAILFFEDWESGNAQGWTGNIDPTPAGPTGGFWIIPRSGGTPSSGTGPLSADCGTNYAYWETSGGTPPVNLNFPNSFNIGGSVSDAEVSFYWHAAGVANASVVNFQVSTDGGANWTTEFTITSGDTPTQGSPFTFTSVDLSAYVGNVIQLRFNGAVDTRFEDIAIDNIQVQACVACTDPAPPVITQCPSTSSPVSTDPGICGADIDFSDLLFTDGCPDDVVITNDINGTDNADGIYPPGITVINWTVTDSDGNQVTCQTTVEIIDLTPPEINCPSDITINLNPGACSSFYSYEVTASDNCPFLQGPFTLPTINQGGNFNSVGGQVLFDVTNLTGQDIQVTELQMRISAGSDVNIFMRPGGWFGFQNNMGAWTQVGTADANTGPFSGGGFGNGTLTTAPTDFVIPPGVWGIVLQTPSASQQYTNGNGGNQSYSDGMLQFDLGGSQNAPWAGLFNPRVWNGSMTYQIGGEAEVVQTQGLPSGAEFNIGTTTNCFEVEDAVGNVSSCCFDVTVQEYQNPTQNLTCNDNVQISLDSFCVATVGADMILEGGPYGCYDTRYTVMVLTPVGQNMGNVVNGNFINGSPWTVKVVDNETDQFCWGSITVEDKLPPIVECLDYSVDCTVDLNDAQFLEPSPAILEAGDPLFTLNTGGNANAVGGAVHFDIENLTGNPLTITELGMNISQATIVDVYTKSGTSVGFQNNAAAWTLTAQADATTGPFSGPFPGNGTITPAPTNFVIPPGVTGITLHAVTAQQNYTNGNGANQTYNDGTIEIRLGTTQNALWTGLFNPRVWNGSVTYLVDIASVPPVDNCSPVTVEHFDDFVDGNCGGPSGVLTRTWKVTDESGNETTCSSIITIDRPDLDDVEIPEDIKWSCVQYDIFPNITDPTALHPYITDCDDATETLDADCYDASCDDLDQTFQDQPGINSTVNGVGCPGLGLDDADVLAVTGSGYPSVGGRPLESLCEIGVEHEDLVVQICEGSWKIVRQWTILDWCADPIDVRQVTQVIKVVDEEAPIIELFGVNGNTTNSYNNSQIPALGNGGGCGAAPQNSGGTVFSAHVQLPGTGQQFNPDMFTNISLKSVLINLSHQNVEDLDIFLRGPSNKVIELTSNNGQDGTGYINTKFVDGATPITQGASPFTGTWSPEGSSAISCGGFNGNVATLADMTTNWQADVLGTWDLVIFDRNPGNIGQLIEWKVNFDFGDVLVDVYNATPTGSNHTICEGSILVPPIQDCTDNCSGVAGYVTELWTRDAAGNPIFQVGFINDNGGYFDNIAMYENGLPARYIVRYYAVDGCDNQSFIDMNIRLRDKVPPIAVCDEITEISITNNGQGTGNSCSTLHAEDLDDGSYDHCTPVYYLMAKMGDSFSQDIYNRCYYPSRDFCCDDIGDNTVILLVLDQDPSLYMTTLNSATLGCDGTPGLFLSTGFNAINYNTCMVTVQVTDKLPPVLISCPANERISCDQYATLYETQLANAADDEEQCEILGADFGNAVYFDNCVANVTCNVTINIDQCLEGTIRRTWSATDDSGNTNSSQNCNQTIFVDHVSDFVVEFPADLNAECGNTPPDFGEPEIFYETCELVAVSYEDQVFTDEPGACYKIVRQWTVINWCVVGDEIDQEVIEDSELDMRLAGCLSIVNLECDLDGDGDCDDRTFRDSWAICTLPNANDATDTTNPDFDPDSDPWDGYITYEQVIKVSDSVDPVFTNGCDIPDVCIGGTTCSATVLLPTPDIDECSVNYTLNYSIHIGGQWLQGAGPYLNVGPGTYDVRYVANDECNNQAACETTVTVVDCKKPTPYCKNGIVVELMVPVNAGDEAMVEVWASDLDDNSFDNCPGTLEFSFSANTADIGRTFTCDDLGQNEVELWVTDATGNQDFCVTTVIIQANMGQCDDDPFIAGVTATEQGEGVENVDVNINSPAGFDVNISTDDAGVFGPVAVPAGGDYTITPVLDVDPLNGVTTYDLVVISKHILGVDLLDSPYQIIAADANKSNSVTTFDLVELRKLILFINTDFPNNTSWRFVDKDYAFATPSNPFAAQFPEVINLNNLNVAELAADFVAIKVGDVNGSADVNFAGSTEDRNMVGDLVLNTDDVILSEGGTYTVEFKATDFAVSGYQFTLNFDRNALEMVEVVSGLATEANFGLTMVNEGVITTSWNSNDVKTLATDEVVFGLTFTAKQSGRLSNLLNINSRYTVAEAYTADAELLNVALSFNNTLVADGFELYQNTPNPFATTTTIGFYLPEATSATLTISDVQGKVVKVIEQDFVKGYNQIDLKRSELGATGVLYYRLDTDSDSATRMMILVD